MSEAERLILVATLTHERTGVIPTDLYARLLEEGVDAGALFNTILEED